MDYYSLFWAPGVISTINEPRRAFTCRSSTLTVLADSGLFRGLLLTFLGPRSVSMINEPPVHLRVGYQHSRFLSILVDCYSPFWGPKAISMVVEPQGVLKCRSSTITVWADSGPFLGLLLSYGGPEMTPGCV